MHRSLEPLPANQDSLIRAIATSTRAWHQPEDLASLLTRDPESVKDDLAIRDIAGWIQVREYPDRILVTLSEQAGNLLGLELVRKSRGRTRWQPQAELATSNH